MSAVLLFNIIMSLLFFAIVLFQFLLQRSLKQSLYNYRNVAYIAAIIFGFVLLVSLYNFLIECIVNTEDLRIRNIFNELVAFPKRFADFAIPVFAVICFLVAISNVALIRHEGLRVKNVLGFILGIVIIGGTYFNKIADSHIEKYVLFPGSKYDTPLNWSIHICTDLFMLLVICYFEVYFIATVIMGYLAAKQVPQYNKDYIIILGCSIDKKGGLLPLLKGRANRAIRYAWQQEIDCGRPVKYIPSGGQGANEVISEGAALEMYLLSHGAEQDEVVAEKKSKNTHENFLFSKQIIDELKPNAKICFATTNYHVYRSGLIAKRMGIKDIEGISSTTKWYFWPNGFIREFVAVLAMEKKLHIISIVVLMTICFCLGVLYYFVLL